MSEQTLNERAQKRKRSPSDEGENYPGCQGRSKADNDEVSTTHSNKRVLRERRRTVNYAAANLNTQASSKYEGLAKADRFQNTGAVIEMNANDFTIDYVRHSKLKTPIVFTNQLEELGMRIPNFSARQIVQKLSNDYYVNAIENDTRQITKMTMKNFVHKFERGDQLEVLQMSAEILDHELLADYLQAPSILRQINWKNNIFPRQKFLDRKLTMEENYVTMAMAGFYGFFYYNTQGESICVHVQSGHQYYFLIEPTSQNFEKFRLLNEDLDEVDFFGNQVEKCTCICLKAGQTLLIPTGWIYSVYSPVNVILYSYHFYHDFSLGLQLELNEELLEYSEDEVEKKDGYVFIYQPLLWYFIADIVKKACGRDYVRLIHSDEYSNLLQQVPDPKKCYNIRLRTPEFYNHLTGNPIQTTFDLIDDKEENNEPETFDDDYIRDWNRDFYMNLQLLRSEFTNAMTVIGKERIAEGIRRPNHLLTDFGRVIQHYNDLQQIELQPVAWPIKREVIELDETEDPVEKEVVEIDESGEVNNPPPRRTKRQQNIINGANLLNEAVEEDAIETEAVEEDAIETEAVEESETQQIDIKVENSIEEDAMETEAVEESMFQQQIEEEDQLILKEEPSQSISGVMLNQTEQPTSTADFSDCSDSLDQKPCPSAANNLSQKLMNLKANDFVVKAGGKQFKILKCFLMCQSAVLEQQLSDDSVKQIEFEDISEDAISCFIEWIHTGQAKDLNDHAGEFYGLANRYDIADLKTECINSFKESLNEENFCQHLILSFEHNDQEFQQYVIEFTKQVDGWRDKLFDSDQWIAFNGSNRSTAKMIWGQLSK